MRPLLPGILFFLALSLPAQGAPVKPRPYGGLGVLSLTEAPLVIYAEPGVQRIRELLASQLPLLARNDQELLLPAAGRKGGWLRIAYDEAGREGWIEPRRSWHFLLWEEFLPGRAVRLLPALTKGLYALRGTPDDRGELKGTLTRDQTVRIVAVSDGWARIRTPEGWFRWRDGDGRLTVLPAAIPLENR
jgi:hypothetical protein